MGSDPGPEDPVYHYHSNYDSYHWMAKFGDPGFTTHKSMAQVSRRLPVGMRIPFSRGAMRLTTRPGSISRCSPTSSPTAS